jgi:hypothetical protein
MAGRVVSYARPAFNIKIGNKLMLPIKKKSKIALIVGISLLVAFCLGCVVFMLVTGVGLSLLDFSVLRR